MKTKYRAPKVWVLSIGACGCLMAGSTGNAVSDNGQKVDFGWIRTEGNAANAAARGGSMWGEEEE